MKVAIIGGHFSPAFCVIQELPKGTEIIYIGRKHSLEGDKGLSLEYKYIKKKGIRFVTLITGRLQRSFSKYTIPSLMKLPIGFLQSIKILREQKPDVVVGFGGYLSFPVILSAHYLKIPIVIHEQTQDAGASNRYLARYADKICISFETSLKYFPKDKTVFTGNPVLKSILNPKKNLKFGLSSPIIYITGGSVGSHFINTLVMGILPKILDVASVIHQTGNSSKFSDFERLQILKDGLNKDKKGKYFISENFFPEEIGAIYRKADLVIGRAGINTVTELITLEKPGLLIPLATTQKNEQVKNANYLKEIGLGEILDQKTASPEVFLKEVSKMLKNLSSYKIKSDSDILPKDSAKKIVKIIYETSQKSNH